MVVVLIVVIIAVILSLLYYLQKKKSREGIEEITNQVEQMTDAEYAARVNEKQVEFQKTRFKNMVTKEYFVYHEQGNFICLNDTDPAKYLKIVENQSYIEEFYTEPRYTIAGSYDKDYYLIYFDGKPYVSLPLLQTLYLFDEEKWRKILYPVEFVDGRGYNFLEFLKLALPARHADDEWLKNTSSYTCNRLYFKDLTVAEILNVSN